jgi:hypothetical protein
MDTSEFDRIAFLAGTVSLLPQDIDLLPSIPDLSSAESTLFLKYSLPTEEDSK